MTVANENGAGGMSRYYKPQYDSDDDLSEEGKAKVKNAPLSKQKEIRKEQWSKEGAYPNLKRALKGAWYGDKQSED